MRACAGRLSPPGAHNCLTARGYGETMNSLPLSLQVVLGAILLIGFVLVVNAPQLLAEWASGKRHEAERRAAQQAELERKLAIADAARAARARGEPFIPPPDYDR